MFSMQGKCLGGKNLNAVTCFSFYGAATRKAWFHGFVVSCYWSVYIHVSTAVTFRFLHVEQLLAFSRTVLRFRL